MEISFLIFGLVLVLLVLFFFNRRDKKYIQKRTKEVLSKDLREEIETERELYYQHKEKFGQSLKSVKEKNHHISEWKKK